MISVLCTVNNMEETDKTTKKKKTMEHANEADKIDFVLQDDEISLAHQHICGKCRKTYPCPNPRGCRVLFDVDMGPTAIRHLREHIWKPRADENASGCVSLRRRRLEEKLQAMLVRDESNQPATFKYVLNGKNVCKDYYKVSR